MPEIFKTSYPQQVLLCALAAVGSAAPQGYTLSTLPAPVFYSGSGIASGSIQALGSVRSTETIRAGRHDGTGRSIGSEQSTGSHHFSDASVSTNNPEFNKNGYSVAEQSNSFSEDDSANNFITSSHPTFGKLKNDLPSSDYGYSSNDRQPPGLLKLTGIHSTNPWIPTGNCKEGEVRHGDGSCVTDLISGKVFLFDAPQQPAKPSGPPPNLPPPKVNQIILFIRLPEEGQGPDPIIVPPPRQDITLFLLKSQSQENQPLVEVSLPSLTKPGVYYVDFGDKAAIPNGLYLQTAVSVISRDDDSASSDTENLGDDGSEYIEKFNLRGHKSSGPSVSTESQKDYNGNGNKYEG